MTGDNGEVSPIVDTAITTAYYTRAFSTPDTIRARAQTAFSIATVVASGLLAAGVLSGLADASPNFQYAAMGVVSLWLVATGASLYAATRPYEDPRQGQAEDRAKPWVKHVVETNLAERKAVLFWQRIGMWATLVALAATLGVVGLWVAAPGFDRVPVRLVLTSQGREAYARICGVRLRILDVTVQPKSLDAEEVVLNAPRKLCSGSKRTVRLPRTDIAASAMK